MTLTIKAPAKIPANIPTCGIRSIDAVPADISWETWQPGDWMPSFACLAAKILCRRLGVAGRTQGGVYLPETVRAKEKSQRVKVLAVGPGKYHPESDRHVPPYPVKDKDGKLVSAIKPGDVIWIPAWGGQVIMIGDDTEHFCTFNEDEVLGIEVRKG